MSEPIEDRFRALLEAWNLATLEALADPASTEKAAAEVLARREFMAAIPPQSEENQCRR